MPFTIAYNVEGVEPAVHKLRAFAARAVEPEPLLKLIAGYLRKAAKALFDEQGRGKWPPLAASTVERKGSSVIGRESDAMMRALTEEGAEGSLEVIMGSELIFGINLTNDEGFPYPVVFNNGTNDGSQPARPLFDFREEDLRGISKAVQAYLVGVDRAEFGLNRGGLAGDFMPSAASGFA